ncbi:neurofilament medium polypeptide-like isoform X2 [Hemicordylus capensis]|uniref:neurofilament medium polypeptide-like isoform X2 n=1 Tax=Hemicordylus capensis TaxID=884348 RepID=UPI00230220A6|nr:neurofilament medium polypeptide-like isoform X2 [Hemicordylus capensis]
MEKRSSSQVKLAMDPKQAPTEHLESNQDEAEVTTEEEEEERVIRKEVEHLLQEELDKLLMEEEGEEEEEEPLKKLLEGQEEPQENLPPFQGRVRTSLKDEVDRLAVVHEEDEEEGEHAVGTSATAWAGEGKEATSATEQTRRPSLFSPGHFFRLPKLFAAQDKGPSEAGTESPKTDRFRRLTKIFTASGEPERKLLDATEDVAPKDRFKRIAKGLLTESQEAFGQRKVSKDSQKLSQFLRLSNMFTVEFEEEKKVEGESQGAEGEASQGEEPQKRTRWVFRGPRSIAVEPAEEPAEEPSDEPVPEPAKVSAEEKEEAAKEEAATAPPRKSVMFPPTKQHGLPHAVWNMGQRISHWRGAHHRGYHIDQVTQDKDYKHRLMMHEREVKTVVPLPLQELIEEEVLAILESTLNDYQEKLGEHHALTFQLQEQVDKLYLRLQGRGIFE